ncbi:hypothetical protein PDIDSM_1907 [Penicillium digitatum]|nr:hypothetical protein PDIDSM_1907 [Penicillium digitatum]
MAILLDENLETNFPTQTEEDRAIIRKLIEDYMTDKRTIILAVMDARNNLANQEVFSMARAADPAGKRIVGIVTKCDALQARDEAGVLRIAKNEVERLTHGWFAEKEFFSMVHPWAELKKDRVDIEKLSLDTQKELEILGPSRQTPAEQIRFLTRLASTYRNEVDRALTGNYSVDLEAQSPLKLRMHLRQHADDFATSMATGGHAKVFRTIQDENDPEFSRPAGDLENIYDWIRRYYLESRGSELPGTVNPVVLQNMFRQQSMHSLNQQVFAKIITDNDVREKIEGVLSQPGEETYRQAHDQLLMIVNDERGGILQTVNHYFADTLSSIRQERVIARLEGLGLQDGFGFDMKIVLKGVHLSNDQQAVFDIHDILKAYYKVAMKRFMDNVIVQVSERYIVGEEGPVKCFHQISSAALMMIC